MSMQVFLMLLFIVSVLVGLTVEAIKVISVKEDRATNLTAGITSVVISVFVGVFYCILAKVTFNAQIVIYLIALVFLSWLCSMVGYDKVVQTIKQIKDKAKEVL